MTLLGKISDRLLGILVPAVPARACEALEVPCYGGGCAKHPESGDCGVWVQTCCAGQCGACWKQFGCAPCYS